MHAIEQLRMPVVRAALCRCEPVGELIAVLPTTRRPDERPPAWRPVAELAQEFLVSIDPSGACPDATGCATPSLPPVGLAVPIAPAWITSSPGCELKLLAPGAEGIFVPQIGFGPLRPAAALSPANASLNRPGIMIPIPEHAQDPRMAVLAHAGSNQL